MSLECKYLLSSSWAKYENNVVISKEDLLFIIKRLVEKTVRLEELAAPQYATLCITGKRIPVWEMGFLERPKPRGLGRFLPDLVIFTS